MCPATRGRRGLKRGTRAGGEDLRVPAVGDGEIREAYSHFVSEVRGRAQGRSKVHVSGGQSEKPDDPSKLVCAVDGE